MLSNPKAKAMLPEYQRIIGLGESAVLPMLEDLAANGPEHWFWALHAVTGENPVGPDDGGNLQAVTNAWLNWGVEAGYPIGVL